MKKHKDESEETPALDTLPSVEVEHECLVEIEDWKKLPKNKKVRISFDAEILLIVPEMGSLSQLHVQTVAGTIKMFRPDQDGIQISEVSKAS